MSIRTPRAIMLMGVLLEERHIQEKPSLVIENQKQLQEESAAHW